MLDVARRTRDFRRLRLALPLQFSIVMQGRTWSSVALLGGALLLATAARAQDTAPTLGASDFTLTLDTGSDVLTSDQLATYFSRARCACPTTLTVTLTIGSDAAAKVDVGTLDAQLMIGPDCDNAAATACPTIGGTLSITDSLAPTATVRTTDIFTNAAGGNCATTTSTRLWAIVRQSSVRLQSEPAVALTLGGAGASAPTDVKAVSSDQGLLVSWTASGDASTLQGHQVLCSPGATTPSTASYDTCGVSASDGGAGPFASLDPQFICSGLIAIGTTSTRIHGLENGRTYQIAVVAVGLDATPSAPSTIAEGTPAPTVGFGDLYGESGGAATGCAVGGSGFGRGVGLAVIAAGLLFARRRWRRRLPLLVFLVVSGTTAWTGTATADEGLSILAATPPSPRLWNVELRFGPYRPNVDSEFADRGDGARPYEEVFSNSRHLMTQLEIDHHLLHRGGTWAAGVGIGYFKVTAAALSQDLQSRSGDQTGLRLIPLSAVLVYRADTLRERWGSPVVPYAKMGLDCTLWRIADTSQPAISGRTFGWHAAAGLTIDLSPLDPDAAAEMDRESGVNQTALFIEVARYSLDGFGSGNALHVGDTTWFAGLMLEL